MIKKLKIEHFKAFQEYELPFDRLNLLVGSNNSGKTTVFHALQLFFWCLDRTPAPRTDAEHLVIRKTQVTETDAVPNSDLADLFHKRTLRSGKRPAKIGLTISTDELQDVRFEIYSAYARNFMIGGCDFRLTDEQYDRLRGLKPIFIPGMVGITVREDLVRPLAQERMIREGNQNSVLRNILYQLSEKPDEWNQFLEIVEPLFRIKGIQIPFDAARDQWLKVNYREGRKWFDLVSAGSGFLQLVNILGFLYLHGPKVALIDEPDSHMHDDLQRLTFRVLERLSEARGIQFLIATHSSTLIDEADLAKVLLVDSEKKSPVTLVDPTGPVEVLSEHGIEFVPSKVIEMLRTRKALFVEGKDSDYKRFIGVLGESLYPGFSRAAAGLTVIQTEGQSAKWPFDAIAAFEQLVGVSLDYVYLSDRDFLLNHQVESREQRANTDRRMLFHTCRRNRECYLLEPVALSRLLTSKWGDRGEQVDIPHEMTVEGLTDWLLAFARGDEDAVRTNLMFQQEQYVRSDRAERLSELHAYFRSVYTDKVANGEIPWTLLDGKKALTAVRRHVQDTLHICFNDREVLEAYRADETPDDIIEVINCLATMLGVPTRGSGAHASDLPSSECLADGDHHGIESSTQGEADDGGGDGAIQGRLV